MVITRVGPLSCAKIAGMLYAVIGLIAGGLFSVAAMAGAFASGSSQGPAFPMLFGAAAIVVLPVIYGCLGFIGTLLMATLYNALAGSVGGIALDIQ
jgi:hypothetical protein